MKLIALLLISITGIVLASSVQQANSELLPNGIYLLQGNGFIITEKIIEDSELDFQFSTGSKTSSRIKITIEDGVTSISNDEYLLSDGWTGTILREGRFLTLAGNAENLDGDEISLRLTGRLVENSEEGSIYTLTGRLTKDDEVMKVVYNVKIVGTNVVLPTEEPEKETKTIRINILAGASNPGNINYYSIDTVEIAPGTTIIWKNEDSVSHRIMSGVASFSPGKPFKPDGKIDSGDIAPGQTFSVTIDNLGITRFFDTTYYWMDGVIISLPETKSFSTKSQ
ncbi:MAG TPA: hypothetical protein VLB45_02630 [Nitrosopumilaceae archaeon]|nr:hypothetical protein [Nitrosopumilaceae archaeon]